MSFWFCCCIVVYGGSGYITECYVEEASTVLESSTTVTKVSNAFRRQSTFKDNTLTRPHKRCYPSSVEYCKFKRPVSKECRLKIMYLLKNRISRGYPHENVLNAETIIVSVFNTFSCGWLLPGWVKVSDRNCSIFTADNNKLQ